MKMYNSKYFVLTLVQFIELTFYGFKLIILFAMK